MGKSLKKRKSNRKKLEKMMKNFRKNGGNGKKRGKIRKTEEKHLARNGEKLKIKERQKRVKMWKILKISLNFYQRDEGGPLLYNDNIQIGFFSYSNGGTCEESRSSTYVRVAHYVPWIQAVLGDSAKELKIASYHDVPCRFNYCSP